MYPSMRNIELLVPQIDIFVEKENKIKISNVNRYLISVVGAPLHPSLGPAVARMPPRLNSPPSNGKSSRFPLLLRLNLPKILRKPPKLLLLLLIDGDGDDCCRASISSIIFSV